MLGLQRKPYAFAQRILMYKQRPILAERIHMDYDKAVKMIQGLPDGTATTTINKEKRV